MVVEKNTRHGASNRSVKTSRLLAISSAATAALIAAPHGFGQTFNPIAATGWNCNNVYNSTGTATTVAFDAYNNFALYTDNAPGANNGYGLPSENNGVFTSQANSNTTFQFQPFTGGNTALELVGAGNAPFGPAGNVNPSYVLSGTINFSTPATYSSLAFLNADANGSENVNYQLNFANGTTAVGSFNSPDWYNGGSTTALSNIGRVYVPNEGQGGYDQGGPQLYENDINVPVTDQALKIDSVTFSVQQDSGSEFNLYAISGAAYTPPGVYVYTGTDSTHPAMFDNSSKNFNFNGSSAAFSNGNEALFDDTATGSHTVTLATGGVSPTITEFNNNSSSYTLNGPGGITGSGQLWLLGTGTVNLNTSNTYTGLTLVQAGTLNMGSGSTVASSSVVVLPGATLNLHAGSGNLAAAALTNPGVSVTDLGVINVYSNNSLGSMVGGGTVNLVNPGTALTLTGGSFAGTLNASGSTLILAGGGGVYAGTITDGAQPNSLVVNTTGAWNVAGSNSFSGGTTVTAGTAVAGSALPFASGPVVVGTNGTLGVNFNGNAVVPGNVSAGTLTIANGDSGVLELSGHNSISSIVINGTSNGNLGGTLQIDNEAALGGAGYIVVQSGGSFLVNDTTGSLGVGATLILNGPGVTSTYSNGNNGPQGALRGADSTNGSDTWAGSIIVASAADIAAGADGVLTLTGSISGGGPLAFTNNANQPGGALVVVAPSLGNSNTYHGETQILPGPTPSSYGQVVQLGANNAFSVNGGLNVMAGVPQTVTVDLNGYNQSVQYLTGVDTPGYSITTTTGQSTLTITSGLNSGVPANLGTAITGNVAVVMNDPTKLGTQILSGTNSYTGGTTITSGNLTVTNSAALGSAPVTLKGGTLGLGQGATTLTNSSFSSLVLNLGSGNNPPTVSGNTLTLTTATDSNGNNIYGTAVSAFFPNRVQVSDQLGFTAKFTMDIPSGYSDGLAFVLQNDPRGATAVSSSAGYELGYGGNNQIVNSAAIAFETYPYNSYNNAGAGTAFTAGGLTPGESGSPASQYQQTGNVGLAQGQSSPIQVTLVYNGATQMLTETLYAAEQGGATFTTTYTGVDYSSLVGGPAGGSTTAYAGFTAGVGGIASTQLITDFSYSTNLTQPQSISNSIVAAAGTTSVIQLGISSANYNTGASVGSLSIASKATLQITVPAGVTNRGVLITPSVSIATSAGSFAGKLDLGSNDLDVTSATLAQVTAMVASGYHGGAWNGNGITSSAAAADSSHLTALGVIINDTGANTTGSNTGIPLYGVNGGRATTFDGTTPSDGDILVKYTYYGDCNLDGVVDGSDYSIIDSTYQMEHFVNGVPATKIGGWYLGDFNYDGVVDGSDYTLMDNAFNQQSGQLGANSEALLASATAQIGAGSSVPEPTSAGVVAAAAIAFLRRRRARNG
jgi:autotransporter-associated beta strand protein